MTLVPGAIAVACMAGSVFVLWRHGLNRSLVWLFALLVASCWAVPAWMFGLHVPDGIRIASAILTGTYLLAYGIIEIRWLRRHFPIAVDAMRAAEQQRRRERDER